jgi:amino acid permease
MKNSHKGSYKRIGEKNKNPMRFAKRKSITFTEDLDIEIGESTEPIPEARTMVQLISSTRKGTILSSFYNLANTILGSGMLGLPYAFSKAGWFLGTFLLIFSAAIASFSLHLLSVCALTQSMPSSFHKVGATVLPKSSIAIDLAVAIKCFGVATSYLIVIGDLMPAVFEGESVPIIWTNRKLWISLMFLISTGLSFLRNLDSLKFTSFLSILFVVLLTLLIGLYSSGLDSLDPCASVKPLESCQGTISVATLNSSTLSVFPIFIFSFTCHQVSSSPCSSSLSTGCRISLGL